MKPNARSHSISTRSGYASLSPARHHDVVECISIRDSDSQSPPPTRRSPLPTEMPARNGRYSIPSRNSSRSFSPNQRRRPPSPPASQLRSRSPSRSASFTRDKSPGARSTRDHPHRSRCLAVFGLNVYTTKHKLYDIFCKFGHIEKLQIVVDSITGRSRGFCFINYEKMSDAKAAKDACTGLEVDQRRIRIDYSNSSQSPTSYREERRSASSHRASKNGEYSSRSIVTARHARSRSERYSARSKSQDRYYVRSRSRSASYSSQVRRMRSRTRSRSMSQTRRSAREKPPQSHCIGVFGLHVYTTQHKIREVFSKFGPIERIQVVIDAQTGRSRGFCFIYYEKLVDAKAAKDACSGMDIDGRRIRVDYSITERPHSPTPGVYMGRPTRSVREREYHERYGDDSRSHRYNSGPYNGPPMVYRRRHYERTAHERSISPRPSTRHH